MNDRLALRPDLTRCALEDRILPAIEFGLFPNPFLQVNAATNQFFVPGTSTSSAGISAGGSLNSNSIPSSGLGSNAPGPSWYFLMIGGNASGVSNGSSVGGSLSLYTISNLKFLPTGAYVRTVSNLFSTANPSGGGGGGGGDSSSSSAANSSSAGATSVVTGFGATFSSGYGFALSSGNNYGMFSSTGATTLGSVPVHTYSGGGDLMDSPQGQNGTDNGAYPNNGGAPAMPAPTPPPTVVPGVGLQGPASKLYDNLLGKNPGQMGPSQLGPGTGIGSGQGQGQGTP
jgi:hypothetical protein